MNATLRFHLLLSNTRLELGKESNQASQPFILSSIPKPHTSLEGVRFKTRPTKYLMPRNTCPESTGTESPHCPTIHLVKHTKAAHLPCKSEDECEIDRSFTAKKSPRLFKGNRVPALPNRSSCQAYQGPTLPWKE